LAIPPQEARPLADLASERPSVRGWSPMSAALVAIRYA